jgi:DNA replication protein DnaC
VTLNGYLSDVDYDLLKVAHPELFGHCVTCQGTGNYTWKGTTHDCDCKQQTHLGTRYAHAGIGLTYMRLGWDDLEVPENQLAPVRDYVENVESYLARGMGLFLSGSVGSGKTLIANLVLKDLVRRGYDCYFTTFAGAVEHFTSTWGDNDEKKRFANRFMRSRVLCLDDLGKEFRSQNGLSPTTFDHILRTRVFEGRPTILTTNLTAAEVKTGYGASVLSLLVEKSIEVPLSGADFRIKAHSRSIAEIKANEMRPIQ